MQMRQLKWKQVSSGKWKKVSVMLVKIYAHDLECAEKGGGDKRTRRNSSKCSVEQCCKREKEQNKRVSFKSSGVIRRTQSDYKVFVQNNRDEWNKFASASRLSWIGQCLQPNRVVYARVVHGMAVYSIQDYKCCSQESYFFWYTASQYSYKWRGLKVPYKNDHSKS